MGGGSSICACVLSEQLGPLRPLAQQTKEQRHTSGTKSRENGELTQRPGPAAQWGALKVLPLHCSPDPLRPFSPIPLKRSTKWVGAKPSQAGHITPLAQVSPTHPALCRRAGTNPRGAAPKRGGGAAWTLDQQPAGPHQYLKRALRLRPPGVGPSSRGSWSPSPLPPPPPPPPRSRWT